jgi:hypothetical protein
MTAMPCCPSNLPRDRPHHAGMARIRSGQASAWKAGSGVSRGESGEGDALRACGVITQGAQLPGTGVRGGSPGEKATSDYRMGC